MSMELILKTPDDAFLKAVEFNYDELKTAITNSLEKYKGLVYDDSQVVEAKKDRSTLNKFKDSMENERKRVKKLCMRAYEESFEPKVKELVALVNGPISEIDNQVKAFEDKKKSEKLEQIRKFWDENSADVKSIITFDRAFNEKWLNVSTSMKSIQDEIVALVGKIKQDLETLENIDSEFKQDIKLEYLNTFDIGQALRHGNDLEQRKKALDEFNKNQIADTGKKVAEVVKENLTSEPEEVKVYYVKFAVSATAEQLQELKSFLQANNIHYERIK